MVDAASCAPVLNQGAGLEHKTESKALLQYRSEAPNRNSRQNQRWRTSTDPRYQIGTQDRIRGGKPNPRQNPRWRTSIGPRCQIEIWRENPTCCTCINQRRRIKTQERIQHAAAVSIQHARTEHKTESKAPIQNTRQNTRR